ncbi:MAG: NUDIX domain-containing protein [Candidatus Paceibacterota bacterium]
MTNIYLENKRLLDIVNLQDKIIDQKPRSEVHRLGLRHREIHVWFFDKNKNIYFQKRGLHRPSAGLLDATIGGHVNRGEEYLAAAIRECKEEAGIKIKKEDLFLLKKIKGTSNLSKDNISGTINNFFRAIYIYKFPITEKQLKKEDGIPGGGFRKIGLPILKNPTKEYAKLFTTFIFSDEIPLILEHIGKVNM